MNSALLICALYLLLGRRNDAGAGNIITFSQFLLIAAEGLVFESKFLTKKPAIPVKSAVKRVEFQRGLTV